MKVGGGGNWPIKLRLECYPRSAIVPAARQNRQPGFDDVDKGANLALTFCLRARNVSLLNCAICTGANVYRCPRLPFDCAETLEFLVNAYLGLVYLVERYSFLLTHAVEFFSQKMNWHVDTPTCLY